MKPSTVWSTAALAGLLILAGTACAADTAPAPGHPGHAGHAGMGAPAAIPDVKVPKATGANARTVEELVSQSAQLKDKPVVVRGRVAKYNGGIMDKNWIHLRDGTGSADKGTNDVVVTTKEVAKVGDIVTVKGTVRTDRTLGAGYSYKVLVEDAALQRP